MSLFKKREDPVRTFKIYMNHSGSSKEEATQCVEIKNASEFMAVVEAEKQYPKLRVFRVERV